MVLFSFILFTGFFKPTLKKICLLRNLYYHFFQQLFCSPVSDLTHLSTVCSMRTCKVCQWSFPTSWTLWKPHHMNFRIAFTLVTSLKMTRVLKQWTFGPFWYSIGIGFEIFSLSMLTRSCSKVYWNKIKISDLGGDYHFRSAGSTKCTKGIDEKKLDLPFSEELPEDLGVRSVNFWTAKLSSNFVETGWCGFLHSHEMLSYALTIHKSILLQRELSIKLFCFFFFPSTD